MSEKCLLLSVNDRYSQGRQIKWIWVRFSRGSIQKKDSDLKYKSGPYFILLLKRWKTSFGRRQEGSKLIPKIGLVTVDRLNFFTAGFKKRIRVRTDQADAGDTYDDDQCEHNCVFDRSWAGFVLNETLKLLRDGVLHLNYFGLAKRFDLKECLEDRSRNRTTFHLKPKPRTVNVRLNFAKILKLCHSRVESFAS